MTVDRLNECRCSITTAYDDCPVHGLEGTYEEDYCGDKHSQREASPHYSQNMPWINVTSSLIGVSLTTDDTQQLTCCERSLQLIQYVFPEISRRCCEEIFELFNYDLYHTIFYIRHNYYIYVSCHSNGQNTQQDKISPQQLQAVDQEFTPNYQISQATRDSSSVTSSIFTDSSDNDQF